MGLVKKLLQNTLIPLSLGAIISGCTISPNSSSSNPPMPTPMPVPTVATNVSVLSFPTSEKISYIDSNTIVFSDINEQINSLHAGNIIVCGTNSQTPSGLLRRIKGVSPDGKTFLTESASFSEMINNYSFNISKSLDNPKSISFLKKGINPNSISKNSGLNLSYNLDNVVLWDLDGNTSTTNDQIIANGNLSFNSYFDLVFSIKNFHVDNFSFKNITTENVDIEVTSIILGNVNRKIKLIDYEFAPIVFYTPTVPPIPIVINPHVALYAGIKGGITSLSTKLKQDANLTTGISYNPSIGWSPICNFTNNFDFEPPTFPKGIQFDVFADSELSVYLYDSVGASASAEGYLGFSSQNNSGNVSWNLYGGLKGNIGAEMKILDYTIWDYNKTLFDYSFNLTNGVETGYIPFADFSVNPSSGNINTEFQFDASASEDWQHSKGGLMYKWDWNDDSVWDTDYSTNCLASHKYSDGGKYSVGLKVKDKDGREGSVDKFGLIKVN